MPAVTSKDGTLIDYELLGSGPPVILVASALSDRTDAAKLASLLASDFSVLNYDRRGRGSSGDTAPFAVEREVEDLEALVEAAGGSAAVFGSSSGAVLALEAAARGVNITRLVVFEPPLVSGSGPNHPEQVRDDIAGALEAGDRRSAVETFMRRQLGMSGLAVGVMRLTMRKMWSSMESMAHTLLYDFAIVTARHDAGSPARRGDWVNVRMPALVLSGEKSERYLQDAAAGVARALPRGEHRSLPGLHHGAVMMAPKKLAPVVADFLARESVQEGR